MIAGIACSCAESPRPDRSAVLVTLESVRADALGCYGEADGASVSPNLDLLAERGVRYARARTVAPLSLPAHASLLTGLYPPQHGVRSDHHARLADAAVTLAELARRDGLRTAAILGSGRLDAGSGLGQGFETVSAPEGSAAELVGPGPRRAADEVVKEALRWLDERDPQRPFFLWVQLADAELMQPSALEDEHRARIYRSAVATVDAAVGVLVEGLRARGLEGESFLAVTAPYGEGLGEHGERGHGLGLWEGTLRVPLLLCYADRYGAGQVSGEVVTVADLAPTLVDAMQLEGALPVQGVDRERPKEREVPGGQSLFYQSVETERGVYFESYEGWRRFAWSPLVGFADVRGKYVRGAHEALFDLRRDPGEARLVVPADGLPERYAEGLRAVLGPAGEETARAVSGLGAESGADRWRVDPRILAELAELGYPEPPRVEGAPWPRPDQVQAPDTRQRLDEVERFERARAQLAAGRDEDAIPTLSELRTSYPDSVDVLDALGSALVGAGDHAGAVEVLRSRLRLAPESVATHRDLRVCFTALGEPEQALRHSIRALELQVELHQTRRDAEALRAARRLLDQARRSASELRDELEQAASDESRRTP